MTHTGTVIVDLDSKEIKALLKQGAADSDGFRAFQIPVRFPEKFTAAPQILLGTVGFSGGGDNFRYRLRPVHVSEASFEIKVIVTGADWIHWIDVSWLATDV